MFDYFRLGFKIVNRQSVILFLEIFLTYRKFVPQVYRIVQEMKDGRPVKNLLCPLNIPELLTYNHLGSYTDSRRSIGDRFLMKRVGW